MFLIIYVSKLESWSPKISPMPGAPGPVAFGQNLGPGVLPQAHYLIPGLGTQAHLPGLGYETRSNLEPGIIVER